MLRDGETGIGSYLTPIQDSSGVPRIKASRTEPRKNTEAEGITPEATAPSP